MVVDAGLVAEIQSDSGDVAGVIRDTFEDRRDLGHGYNKSQIAGSRLPESKNIYAPTIDLHFELIDLIVAGENLLGSVDVSFNKRIHGTLESSLSFTTEQQNAVAQKIDVSIELSLLVHLRKSL
jgi:hypothetical protein